MPDEQTDVIQHQIGRLDGHQAEELGVVAGGRAVLGQIFGVGAGYLAHHVVDEAAALVLERYGDGALGQRRRAVLVLLQHLWRATGEATLSYKVEPSQMAATLDTLITMKTVFTSDGRR